MVKPVINMYINIMQYTERPCSSMSQRTIGFQMPAAQVIKNVIIV